MVTFDKESRKQILYFYSYSDDADDDATADADEDDTLEARMKSFTGFPFYIATAKNLTTSKLFTTQHNFPPPQAPQPRDS